MSDKANAEVVPQRRFRMPRPPRLGKWALVALVVLVAGILAAAGGVAYATYDYSRDYDGRILPGARVAGVDLGGMTRAEAIDAVDDAIAPRLDRTVTLEWKNKSWQVTPAELGASANVEELVDAAVTRSASASFVDRARMRFLEHRLSFARPVAITYSRSQQRAFLRDLAAKFNREARDAALDYSTGWVEIERERAGRTLNVRATARALMRAFRTDRSTVGLAVKDVKPEVTADSFDQVLLLRIGENKLYLYQNGRITDEWSVATGQPEYPTPTGVFYIELKRYMPTWINPAPDGWGASMPKMIPPGPGNPLGTRALNWTAPGIRFHGTQATGSIGYNASHGCVRLTMPDVEALYDMVDVGTSIVSIQAGSLRPQYSDPPALRGEGA